MSGRSLAAAMTALLAGCEVEDLDDEAARSDWIDVAVVRFADDGVAADLQLPAGEPLAAWALRAATDPGVCFQLASLVDGEGRAPIDGRSAGPYCRDCELRTSVAVEAGVFVLPREEGRLEPDRGLSLRFARVDCRTLTPLTEPHDRPALHIEALPLPALPERATIDLRFLVAAGSILSGDDDRQRALMAALEQELASGGLTPRLVETRDLAAPLDRLRFHAGDPGELAAALAEVEPTGEATIDVVFGGCLLHDDPFFGPPAAVDGYTPRIPGGAGPADAVFMPGRDCLAGPAPLDVPVRTQARVLAHEIGHYLGLYHTVELDGLADTLDDTTADNTMNPRPTLATAAGFTPSQARVMQMHPAVRRP